MKTTYNGTYTQVDELESVEGVLILKQRLKDNAMQDSFVRSNFLSGARFLQSLKDSSLLTIEEVIEKSEEVSIVCKNDGFQQLGVYLETQSQLSDAFIVELIQKMLRCLDYLHQNSLFHQGLNPNSFVVNKQGEVKLTLFGTLEHRLYHHLPAIGDENSSIQNAICFYSPERKVNYGAINLASENYSFGLIIWYLKCVQLKLTNTTDLVLNFPEYSSTGSVWDEVIEACLQDDPKKRPKSAKEIIGLLPAVEKEKIVLNTQKEETPIQSKKVTIRFSNYNSAHHDIKVDGIAIESLNYKINNHELTIEVDEGVKFQVFMKKDGSFLTLFNSSSLFHYTLPVIIDDFNTQSIQVKKPKKNSLFIGLGILVILVVAILIKQCNGRTIVVKNSSENATNVNLKESDSIIPEIQDSIENSEPNDFPYSNIQIKDFLRSYYNMLNNQDIESFESYLEPVVEKYFLVSNGRSVDLKKNYADWLSKNSSTAMLQEDLIRITRNSEFAQVKVPLYFKSINLSNGKISEYEIIHEITLSKNLKIKKLIEKILKKY
jgi:serine/threonine protein kinase